MTRRTPLVNGAWQQILMANYIVDPSLLEPCLPWGTQLAFHDGQCFLTVAGLIFSEITVLGVKIPFHRFVPEVNLRFYVVPSLGNERNRRGIVFVREIISRRIMAFAANMYYKEHYVVGHVGHTATSDTAFHNVRYEVGSFELRALLRAGKRETVIKGSKKDFILHNFFGYSGAPDKRTTWYRVMHPSWQTEHVVNYDLRIDFTKLFGDRFAGLNRQKPDSVYYTAGSAVSIYKPKPLMHQFGGVEDGQEIPRQDH
jgi:uncharacterized protein YqjF (DUF2071 family)